MQKLKICQTCGKEFYVPNYRKEPVKYCCRECANIGKMAQKESVCTYCGKAFHAKKYKREVLQHSLGLFCSRECVSQYKKIAYSGSGNHQWGLKGHLNGSFKNQDLVRHNHKLDDILVYCPTHPFKDKDSRVKKHRLIVEANYQKFNSQYFVKINEDFYLKPEIEVHHIDNNHNNNDITNLMPCTKSEHMKIHNKDKIIIRDSKGRITAVVKREELLETPEMGNQQPSLSLTTKEGSETNS